ncbi:hypothetical protein SAMN05216584_1015 [Selenomonas sp. WCT3]|uniref:hypothetical protein n=1 Tax=Selenomonas sp. WCT3 TaxID=3158785 RepID=UPI00088941DD|nr:hypothetical protein SAMN05216584_1015 [Selenomonas ruminantium]
MDYQDKTKSIEEMQELFRLMVNAHEQMKFATLSLYQACKETKDVVGKRGIEEYLKILSVQERWLDLVKKNNKAIKTTYDNVVPLPNLDALDLVDNTLEEYCPTRIRRQIAKHVSLLETFKDDLKHMPSYIAEPCRYHVVTNIGKIMPGECYRCTVLYDTYELDPPKRLRAECRCKYGEESR